MNQPLSLRALVTGATGGIGRATCFAPSDAARARGASLSIAVAASRPGAALDALVARLREAGAQAHGFAADLADPSSCERLAREAIAACSVLATVPGKPR